MCEYSGVLVSDFYGGYDSVACKQQKCWVHLLRDINDDLWGSPFDVEYETFVLEIKKLILLFLYGLYLLNLHRMKKKKLEFNKQTLAHYLLEYIISIYVSSICYLFLI